MSSKKMPHSMGLTLMPGVSTLTVIELSPAISPAHAHTASAADSAKHFISSPYYLTPNIER